MSKRKKKTKKKVVKKAPQKTWENGDNPIGLNLASPMSYEKYMKSALEIMSKRFEIRTYKLAPQDDYPGFIRGKDLRVQIWFEKKYLGYEFIIELAFWQQTNRNKEERLYMRGHANQHLKIVHNAVLEAKEKIQKVTKKTKVKKSPVKKKTTITTQDAFDKNIAKEAGPRKRKKAIKKK